MIACPDCSAVLKPPGKRCACGWQDASQRAPSASPASIPDALRWNCADERAGQRCAKWGSFSSSTQGSERWYCDEHFPQFRAWREGKASGPTLAYQAIRATMRKPTETADAQALAERLAIENDGAP